jgi:helicase
MMMEGNLLLEQYGKFKKAELEGSPFRCLLNTKIEINPHQINAFCAAIQALKTGGIVLADEVGLGKTIEAGLTLKYVLDSGAKRVLIALPATLRKQWEVELEEKFSLKATILDRLTVESNLSFWKSCLENRDKVRIVITSYDYSSKLMQRFPNLKWDFIIIDEAHNLRNVFHGTKRAKRLYELSKGIPKILLTATPLQNSLSDLHGLISFIDPRIFGSEKVFNKRFIEGQDYPELKRELIPVLYRTLRRDVGKYMDFKKRECRTIDFELSPDEVELYMRVNNFLKRDVLYSIPNANKGLIVLVIRKLLASSSYALIETFEVLKNRLQKLYEGTKSANAQDGFALFWDFVEDEIDESAFEEIDDEDTLFQKQQIQAEMDEVDAIIETASRIQSNAKIKALKTAIHTAFEYQGKQNIPQKVVVFTESKRTQKYIAAELCKDGFEEDDILLFNGDFNDAMTKEIYRAWQVKNFGKTNYGRSVEYKHAIVDYFKEHSKVLIVTDAGSEGLNLQFCNTVINYDLPWNPQKIEQRIGRCHRYGQKNNVVAINLLNTTNEADRRIYEILSKKFELFDGVFGASDIALGTLESGSSFEKTILDIYQKCGTKTEFKKAFDRLDKKIDAKRNKKVLQLQSILMTASDIDKNVSLEKTNNDIKQYLKQVDFWSQVADSDVEGNLNYWKINNWGEKTFGSHGTLFIGAFCNSNNEMLFPVLLLCDEFGQYVDFSEEDIVRELETVDDIDIKYFKPTNEEIDTFKGIYNNLLQEMFSKYQEMTKPLRDYNKHKVENWVDIQREQLGMQIAELNAEIGDLSVEEFSAKEFLRKVDIRKKLMKK